MALPALDATDLRILTELLRDARLSNVELAQRINLSESPCLRRVKRLEEAGVLKGARAIVARKAVGLGLTVFAGLKAERHTREVAQEIGVRLAAMPEVVACHMVSGESDFLIEVVVPDLDAYEAFLTDRLLTLPSVKDVRSNFSLRTIKTDGPLPVGARPA